MARAREAVRWPGLIMMAGLAQCGSDSDAPPPQVLLYVDTDAPAASRARSGPESFLSDAAVDTLIIEVLDRDNRTMSDGRIEITAPDEENWPVSLGVDASGETSVVRLRIRAFQAQQSGFEETDPDTHAQAYVPDAAYTIDRVVELPLPNEKGSVAFRVVLRSECRGVRPDFAGLRTCVSGTERLGDVRSGIEAVAPDQAPTREPIWWPSCVGDPLNCRPRSRNQVCNPNPCDHDAVCIPGGFFTLGNTRVVGFASLDRHDAIPPHPVAMRPFCIDRTEVTAGRYGQAPSRPPPNAVDCADPTLPAHANRPMNCVTWGEAAAFCGGLGGRLPTEAEWEYVATGLGRGTLFPWSDQPPTCNREDGTATANLERYSGFGLARCPGPSNIQGVLDVGTHPEDAALIREGEAVMDLAGSLSEWTGDPFVSYDKGCWRAERGGLLTHPRCTAPGTTHSVRGGSYRSALEVAYSALRGDRETNDTDGATDVGFRCVYFLEDDPSVEIRAEDIGDSP